MPIDWLLKRAADSQTYWSILSSRRQHTSSSRTLIETYCGVTLGKVVDHYEAAVRNSIESLRSLIEPIIMSVTEILICGLMIAMYLPIFMLRSVI